MRTYSDRTDAGRELAERLATYRGQEAVVYGLPRGGIVVAFEVALAIDAPLDLIVARKIGHPGNPEYAVGAITDDGSLALNEQETAAIPLTWLEGQKQIELDEAIRRRARYLAGRPDVPVAGKIAILVDDGIATGYTMEAAIASARERAPAKIVVAVPVAPGNVVHRFSALADEVVIGQAEDAMVAVGQWYEDFAQVDDDTVIELLRRA